MRTIVFKSKNGVVTTSVTEEPPYEPIDDSHDAAIMRGDVYETFDAQMHFVRLAPGATLPMHSSEDLAYCFIPQGRGRVGLPGGEAVQYIGPELLVFLPNTEHDFHDVTQETVLAVCVVKRVSRTG